MLRANVVGDIPNIDSTSFVDPSAIIIGRVEIGPNCYIGAGVVIRADRFSSDDSVAAICIGANCGIQDMAVLHAHAESALSVGSDTIINHGAVLHGTSQIGSNCFIGCKAVITSAILSDGVFVRTNAVIEEVTIPPDRFIAINSVITNPDAAATLRPITAAEREFMDRAIQENREYPVRYKYSLER